MKKKRKAGIRTGLGALFVVAAIFIIWRVPHAHATPSIPVAEARNGEFAVLVHTRGKLIAGNSIQLAAPPDVQDLQIVWLAPSGSEVKAGDPVVRFDPSKLQQEHREKTVALEQAQASLDQTVAEARITADQDKLDLASARFDMEKARLEAAKKATVSAMDGEKSTIDFGLSEQKIKLQQATMDPARWPRGGD